MLGPTKTKTKKPPGSKENKNSKKVISVKCGLRQPKIIKSKVSNAVIGKKHLKNRNNSTTKVHNRNTVSEKLRKRTSKIDVLTKKNTHRSKLNTRLRNNSQTKISDKEKSLKAKTILIYSKDTSKSCSSGNPIFVCLGDTDEEKMYKSKFRRLTSAVKLKRLRENLWKKSSYHKRFLGKSGNVKSQKSEKSKSKAVKNKKNRLSPKQGNNLQKSEMRNSSDNNVPTEKKNLQHNTPQSKPSNQDMVLTEESLNLEIPTLDSKKSSKNDVSMIDERFMKSLLSIANCGNKPQKVALQHLRKDFYSKPTKTDYKIKISGKEFFTNKIKNPKITSELNGRSAEGKTSSLDPGNRKSQRNPVKEKTDSASVLRDTTKSETQIKPWKRKTADTKSKEVKNKAKKAYSKHEISDLQQKKKTRNIVKNKKEDNIEIPFPCDVLKVGEIQELWKRENSGKHRTSRSSESSSTIVENSKNQNDEGLGLESYQVLKKFVTEEVYRISKNYNKSDLPKNKIEKDTENRDKETCKDRNLTSNEKQISNLVRKKLAVKSRENFLHGEKQLRNAETLKCVNLSHRGKAQSVKSKLKLLEEKKNTVKKIPDEVIKNWSIVNRLEQAFLALGTPSFRKEKEKEPAIPKAKAVRTIPRYTSEVKRVEKQIKECEKNELKPVTRIAFYKQRVNEIKKTNEKQLRVLHKKEPTTNDRKPGTASSASSRQSSKIGDKSKSSEEKTGPPQEENARVQLQEENSRLHPQEAKVRLQLQEEKARLKRQNSAPPCKPSIKPPTARFSKKSGIKPPTPVENLCSSWNKIMGYQRIGKVGKKNSPRNHLCESSRQNKNDDNLERKKTFQVISLKDSVIMQPRRSKSCNKIDRNSELDKKNNVSSTRNLKFKSLTSLKEKHPNLPEHLNETGKKKTKEDFKNNEVETEQPASNSKDFGQKSGRSGNYFGEDVKRALTSRPNKGTKREQTPSQDTSEQARGTKDVNGSGKTRSIKERSILSIRTNQHENQTSRANISQIQEERTPLLQDASALPETEDGREATKVQVFLPPKKSNLSESSCTSLSIFNIATSKSSVKNCAQVVSNDDELKLLKAPSMSPSKSTQIIASQTSTGNGGKPKTACAPWEQDIHYYRSLVKDIMSQHKRLGGFLKQSENLKALPEEFEALKSSKVLKEKISIREYRKKIMMEYQEVPILEYKSKMEEMQKKVDRSWKRKNLFVFQPVNTEMDLDVKDYEPKMRTFLSSRLCFDKENFGKSQEINRNLTEKKLSLQGVIMSKNMKSKNCSITISMPKSCVCLFDSRKPEEKCLDDEYHCIVSTSNLNNV